MAEVPRTVRDAAYVVVGFGVLAAQRAQVRRRELSRKLRTLEECLPTAARDVLDVMREGVMREGVMRQGQAGKR
ncbi:MAG: hypothetical protein M3Q48_16675 [Actinomycetota bacterium]|nr:hypothetical protein [Actinomycetota bacterium]